jgi:hypothetical protein
VKDATREWIIRREKTIGITVLVTVAIVAAVLLPQKYMKFVIAGMCVAIGVFVLWTRGPSAPPIANPQIGPSIREHLRRAHAWSVRIFVLLLLIWIGTALIIWPSPAERGKFFLAGIAGALVLNCVAMLIGRPYVRCPQCRTDFRKERIAKLGRWSRDPRGAADLWDSCPTCGVSFDAPYPR